MDFEKQPHKRTGKVAIIVERPIDAINTLLLIGHHNVRLMMVVMGVAPLPTLQ